MTWADIVGAGDASAGPPAMVTAGEAKALLARIDAEVKRLDAAIRASDVSKQFRRAWARFLHSWRWRFDQEMGRPSRTAARSAAMLASEIRQWRLAFARDKAARAAGVEEAEVGAFIITPGMTKAEMETVEAGIKQLDADIMASKVREPFKKAWRLFVTEWQKFHSHNAGWWTRGFSGTYEKVIEFKKRVDEWRQAFAREGGQATGPTLSLPEQPGGSFKWWVVGGLLVAGAVVGAKALR